MKTFRLWTTFLSFSAGNLVAYRVDLLLRMIGMFLNVVFMMVVLMLPYKYTESLAGWGKHEVILVIGMYYLMNGLSWALFKDGIFRIEDKVKYGFLDSVLMKPVDSAFVTAFFEVDMTRFADALVGLVIIVSQVIAAGIEVDLLKIVAVLVSCVASLAIVFALYLSANTLSFWTTEAYIGHVSNPLFTIAKYPVDVWGENISQFFYWVLPIGFMSSVPSAILLGKLPLWWAAIGLGIAGLWVIGSKVLWNIALTKYSGVGS